MKVYKCDICEQYVDDYQHINRGGKGFLRLTFNPSNKVTCDICDTCYDFLEAYTKWDQETRKDIYNYVINKRRSKPETQTKKLNEKEN